MLTKVMDRKKNHPAHLIVFYHAFISYFFPKTIIDDFIRKKKKVCIHIYDIYMLYIYTYTHTHLFINYANYLYIYIIK